MSLTAQLEAAERRLAQMVNRRADAEEAQARADAAARMMAERERAREDASVVASIRALRRGPHSTFNLPRPASARR